MEALHGLTSTQAMSRRVPKTRNVAADISANVYVSWDGRDCPLLAARPPPANVGAAKAHEVCAACMIARKPHRLHYGLGSRHVERDLILAGDMLQARDVVGIGW